MGFVKSVSILLLATQVLADREYGQCGGIGWTGPTTCAPTSKCIVANDYFWQCTPQGTSTISAKTTTTSIKPSPSPNVPNWGQCGGISWTGGTVCQSGWTCTYSNQWHSQCLPPPEWYSSYYSSLSAALTATSSSSSQTPTLTSSTSTPTPSRVTAPQYGQCGGTGFTGPTVCPDKWVCTFNSQFNSQCLPGPLWTTSSFVPVSTSSTSARPEPTRVKYIYSFGDDYSSTGFNIKGTKPTDDNRLGNPPYPGLTTSGGENWVSRMAYDNYFVRFFNFASAGATTDATIVRSSSSGAMSFIDQVSLFLANLVPAPSYAPDWDSINSVFVVWIGINDIQFGFTQSKWAENSKKVVNQYFKQVDRLYAAGARKFAFLQIPPIQRTPLMMSKPKAVRDQEAAAIASFNSLLNSSRIAFEAAHSGSRTKFIETTLSFTLNLDYAVLNGYPNATCYNADGKTCLWADNFHPGHAIHSLVYSQVDFYLIDYELH